jgi:hypothetical protein
MKTARTISLLFFERSSSQHILQTKLPSSVIAMLHLNIIPRILLVLVALCAAIASAAHPFRLVLNQGGTYRSTADRFGALLPRRQQ